MKKYWPVHSGQLSHSRRTCNFCGRKRLQLFRCDYISWRESSFSKTNHFFEKKIFRENHLWGTSAAFFEKIVLLENIFYHTSSDAVLPADFEYHLSFALRCYFKGKKQGFWGSKTGLLGTTNSVHIGKCYSLLYSALYPTWMKIRWKFDIN